MSDRKPIIPAGHEVAYKRFHFPAAFRVGDTIHVSGIIGVGADGKVPDAPADEFTNAFEQLARTLDAAGGRVGDVVEITSFHVDMDVLAEFMAAKDAAIGEPYPAWTAVGTTALVVPGARAEVKVTAVVPADR